MMIRGKLESPRELPQHEIVVGETFMRRIESGQWVDKDGKVLTVEELSLDIYEK